MNLAKSAGDERRQALYAERIPYLVVPPTTKLFPSLLVVGVMHYVLCVMLDTSGQRAERALGTTTPFLECVLACLTPAKSAGDERRQALYAERIPYLVVLIKTT